MSRVEYHVPSSPEGGQVCLYDQEEWPCLVTRIRMGVIKATAAELVKLIGPLDEEPKCCDEHFRYWEGRKEAAEEIEDWVKEKMEKINEPH